MGLVKLAIVYVLIKELSCMAVYDFRKIVCFTLFSCSFFVEKNSTKKSRVLVKLITPCFGNSPDVFLFLTNEPIPPILCCVFCPLGKESGAAEILEMYLQQHWTGSVCNPWVSRNLFWMWVFPPVMFVIGLLGCLLFVGWFWVRI